MSTGNEHTCPRMRGSNLLGGFDGRDTVAYAIGHIGLRQDRGQLRSGRNLRLKVSKNVAFVPAEEHGSPTASSPEVKSYRPFLPDPSVAKPIGDFLMSSRHRWDASRRSWGCDYRRTGVARARRSGILPPLPWPRTTCM